MDYNEIENQEPKKGKGGIIAAIAIASVAVVGAIVAVVLLLTGVIGGEKLPGFYKISGLTVEGEKYSSRDIRDMDAHIVLSEDGSGWLYYKKDVTDITWDDQAITLKSDRTKLSYVLEDGVLTMGDPDETEYVFTRSDEAVPDKPAPRPDISDQVGIYYLIEANGNVCEENAGFIEIYEDYTALVDVNLSETVEFDIDRRTITFLDYGGTDIEASIRNGVIEAEIDGEDLVFAMEDTDRYAAWLEASTSAAGYYTLIRMGVDGEWITGEEVKANGGEIYLVFHSDNTGYFVADYTDSVQVYDVTWDDTTIYPVGMITNPYTIEGNVLTMTEGDLIFEFERVGDEEDAPERPQSSAEANGSVTIINMMDQTVNGVWLSDATSSSWGGRTVSGLTPDAPVYTTALPQTGLVGLYDIRVEMEDGSGYYIYEVMIAPGYYIAIDYNDNQFDGYGDYDPSAEYMLTVVDMEKEEILMKYTLVKETQ